MTKENAGQVPPLRPLRNPKPYFDVGQPIVCVDASPNHVAPRCKPLVAGRIHGIRAIDIRGGWKWPWWGVHLEGIFIFHPDGHGEWASRLGRLRAVTECQTDITVFKALAAVQLRRQPACIPINGQSASAALPAPVTSTR